MDNDTKLNKIKAKIEDNIFQTKGITVLKLINSSKDFDYIVSYENVFHRTSKEKARDIIKQRFEELDYSIKEFYIAYNDEEPKDNKELSKWFYMILSDVPLVLDQGYKPNGELIYIDQEGHVRFNTYKAPSIESLTYNITSEPFKYTKQLLMHLCDNNKKLYAWINNRIAYSIKHHEDKVPTAIIFQGEKGSGKNRFTEWIIGGLFRNNHIEITQDELNSSYNPYMSGKQWVICNEVFHGERMLSLPSKLKSYLAATYIPISEKYLRLRMEKNYASMMFTSNKRKPLEIEEGDRRYVFATKWKKSRTEKPVDLTIIENLKANLKQEISEYYNYLVSLNPTFKQVSTTIENKAKQEVIKLSKTSFDLFIDEVEELGGFNPYYQNLDNVSTTGIPVYNSNEGLWIETSMLYELYEKFCRENGTSKYNISRTKFTINLKIIGYESKVRKNTITKKTSRCFNIETENQTDEHTTEQ